MRQTLGWEDFGCTTISSDCAIARSRSASDPHCHSATMTEQGHAELRGLGIGVHGDRSRLGQGDAAFAIPGGGVVAVTVVARTGLFVVSREPPGHAEDLPANAFGGRGRIVQDDRGGHDHVDGSIRERQMFAAAEEQADFVPAAEIMAGLLQLGGAEIDAQQGDVQAPPDLVQELAVSAADLQDRVGLIGGQPVGDPLGTAAPCRLAFLFPKIIIAAAKCPVTAGIGV